MFLGTDDGLYVSFDAGSNWDKWTHGFPTTSVKDLVIHPREHDLVIGTFGRAAWVLDDIRPLRALAADKSTIDKTVALFEPPVAYQAAYQQPTGSRFGGDALFNGENREFGARIRYYYQPSEVTDDKDDKDQEEEADTDGPSKDSLYMKIYDGNRLIRSLKRKVPDSAGIYSWTWYMDEAGVDRPSRTIRKRNNEPGGTDVKPGTYRIELSHMDQQSTTNIRVATDPRLQVSERTINEAYDRSKLLEGYTQTAADAVRQLVESKEAAEDYSKRMKKLDEKGYKELIDETKEVTKKIDSIVALYLGKVDRRQGITRSPLPTVMSRIQVARSYAGSRPNGMTATENRLLQQARNELDKALGATNAFFQNDWPAFKAKLEATSLSPFKETEVFSID